MLLLIKFDVPFDVHTDTREYKLGRIVFQEHKSVVILYRKLTDIWKG